MTRNSKIFFILFFAAIAACIALTYYTIVVRQGYTVFTDPTMVPNPADYIGGTVIYLKNLL